MAPPTAVAAAWAALYGRDAGIVNRCLGHLTPSAVDDLTVALTKEINANSISNDETQSIYRTIGEASLRRLTYRCMDKFQSNHRLATQEIMQEALQSHVLPEHLKQELVTKYGQYKDEAPPQSWYEALEQLQQKAKGDKAQLWRLILDHPMTAYVPVQCQECGHVIPDDTTCQTTDQQVGLVELEPTGEELELRAGWYRGPRKAVRFQITCTQCGHVSYWYRSGHPRVILNPHKWGRLCGEQEDLRSALAYYLDIPLRLVVPLDWDHIWSEYGNHPVDSSSTTGTGTDPNIITWQVEDDSARNFACRLDEGIGSWTRVLAIHPNPTLCQDVTNAYLSCQKDGGRAEDQHDNNMPRYRQTIQSAREDPTGAMTQSRTLHGFVLEKGQLLTDDNQVTSILQHAANDHAHGNKDWWQF
ncbi:expressed unknown protein [Seminavis robusta]|uniref:Uncharacterized protein n=1 Tax=Seminavis robusta TaxID=568900 RepID=A0A9N8HUF6_9STRA|nr:expressed unknown protein [Seminavis robusta]|eukprot:Sro2066_g313240.1 n/a (415) ;mRNA; f:559-1803